MTKIDVKKAMFFENARLLFEKFGILPLMYGSLGLEYVTGEELCSDDIDILIPSVFINEKWGVFKSALEDGGYALFDEREHSFKKSGVCFSYAPLEELEDFAGIGISDIEIRDDHGASFRVLSLEQYLRVYESSSKDGYRINVRKKKDADKIAFIKSRLR